MVRAPILFCTMIALFTIVGSDGFAATPSQGKGPNILFILTDDQRWDSLGCYGNESIKTPNLDRVADQGARLDHFYVASPWCCPSRAVFLTGLYPHQTGIVDNERSVISVETVASMLNKAGYATGFVGKAHLNGKPLQWGFQEAPVYLERSDTVHENPELVVNGQMKKVPGLITEIFTDAAIGFVEKHRENSWFLWFATTAPHTPYLKDPKFKYDPSQLKMPPGWPAEQGFRMRKQWAEYYSLITMMDEQLGRLLQKLDELNLSKDTFVFFTSDNGHMMGSHGYSSKQQWHDESTRVPAIARWPGKIKPKTVIKSLMSSIDFPSTLLDLVRMKPMNANGKSMVPVLTGAGSGRQEVFSEVERSDKEGGGYWQMVRTDRNKYVRFLDGEEHFYDLQADPSESCNIVRHKRSTPEFAALREMLQKWLNSTPAVPRKQKD